MNTADYASGIRGFRLFQEAALGYEYQATSACSPESATRLMTDLPPNCEISFFDPEEEKEEAYIIRREPKRGGAKKGSCFTLNLTGGFDEAGAIKFFDHLAKIS